MTRWDVLVQSAIRAATRTKDYQLLEHRLQHLLKAYR